MKLSKQGADFIKSFEGCRLEAYHGAADRPGLYTIGYGHTGKVQKGQKITQAEADRLFSGVQYMFPHMQTDTCVAFGAMIGYLGTDYVKLVLQSLIPAHRSEAQKAVDKSETETDNTSDS